ncbi:MAG: MerR family transcriptional regulator [Defluviitaleaceae bacterium]|nr:MerR family transcriptional regulator [Defluviitaleaceae bacterium]
MEYTINKLATLAGVSTRTLRYYDQCKLLTPVRSSTNGYRIYGQKEVDRLQHILFYRELDVPLEQIHKILENEGFDSESALQGHLSALLSKKRKLDLLIANVEKTISVLKGETIMKNNEKFSGFSEKLVQDNEKLYGAEIREKYGDDTVNKSNAKVRGMTEDEYMEVEKLSEEFNAVLKAAFEQGDPASDLAQKACELHKQWLCYFWDKDSYSKEAHIGMAQMYVDDPRFTAYYDKIVVGCAPFLRDAVEIYCKS